MLAAMSQRVRSSLSTAVVWLVAGAVVMVGLVWITIWAVGRLSVHVGAWAALLAVSGLAVVAGRFLLRHIKLSLVFYAGAAICLALEALTIYELAWG